MTKLWIVLLLFFFLGGLAGIIQVDDSTNRTAIYLIGVSLAMVFVKLITNEEAKKKAEKKFRGRAIVGLPERGQFEVLNQGMDEVGWRFLRLKNINTGEIYSYTSCVKLLDQDGQEIKRIIPKRIVIQKHVKVEINKSNRYVKSDNVYYVFPLPATD